MAASTASRGGVVERIERIEQSERIDSLESIDSIDSFDKVWGQGAGAKHTLKPTLKLTLNRHAYSTRLIFSLRQ